MSTIILQIMLAFNAMIGAADGSQPFGGNNVQQGIVIIDGDELGGRR